METDNFVMLTHRRQTHRLHKLHTAATASDSFTNVKLGFFYCGVKSIQHITYGLLRPVFGFFSFFVLFLMKLHFLEEQNDFNSQTGSTLLGQL